MVTSFRHARRGATLRDTLPPRRNWADLVDSSQDCSQDNTFAVPSPPIVDNSYDTPAPDVDSSKSGLNSKLAEMEMKRGPIDFTFLMQPTEVSTPAVSSNAASSNSTEPRSEAASQGFRLNPVAPEFVPSTMHLSPCDSGLPSSASPQEMPKPKRTKGKRPSSSVQASTQKKAKDLQSESKACENPTAVSYNMQPPEASEEEWKHRISKRNKAIASIKEFPEYLNYSALRPRNERRQGEPRTPKADDRQLSKRRWEYEIQKWRTHLKSWSLDGNIQNIVLEEAEEENASPSMEAEQI